MKRILLLLSILITTVSIQYADEPQFKAFPTGRVLIDGALYASPEKELFKDGMAIPEARVGVRMNYGKWSSWIDVGIAYGKIGLRNMWINYDFDKKNSIRIGNYIQPYGLNSTTTLSNKCTFEQPLAAAIYTPGILLGMMYNFKNPSFWAAGSFHVESSALTNVMNYPQYTQQGYGILTRLIWRDKNSFSPGNLILQAGISAGFATPERTLVDDVDVHNAFAISGTYPTKVTTLTAIGTTVDKAMNQFKFTPELVIAYKRLALEASYFFQSINRRQHLKNYVSQSGFITLRGVLFGGDYTYDGDIAYITNPKKNALELVLNYNYATLSDPRVSIFGGRANSFNATFNYYFNPYVTARLNYTYTHTWNRSGYDPTILNGFQARIMVMF